MQIIAVKTENRVLGSGRNFGAKTYLALLQSLFNKNVLGRLIIYPAAGVDGLPVFFAPTVALNRWAYTPATMLEYLVPIFGKTIAGKLEPKLRKNLTYLAGVDIMHLKSLHAVLEPYRETSPKSIIIKGLVRTVFSLEWDRDMERSYPVSAASAQKMAENWAADMIEWLKPGDALIVFDPAFFSFLTQSSQVREVPLGIPNLGEYHNPEFQRIIGLPGQVRVFRKIQ